MGNSIKDAFKKAQARAIQKDLRGQQLRLPGAVSIPLKGSAESSVGAEGHLPKVSDARPAKTRDTNQLSAGNTKAEKPIVWPKQPFAQARIGREAQAPRLPASVRMAPEKAKVPPPPMPGWTTTIRQDAHFALDVHSQNQHRLLPNYETLGLATQVHEGRTTDTREVVIGLDFGTSCVKVVIGDEVLGRAFAVPFCIADGVAQYLLPTRLHQTGNRYSLNTGEQDFRDLKLSLLANPDHPLFQRRIVAFLALVIRRARGWLLSEQEAVFKKTRIVWKLTIGLPAAHHFAAAPLKVYRLIGQAAWAVSVLPGLITDTGASAALADCESATLSREDIEVSVIPEIAAQIYGFVSSRRFDKQAPNIYLMADVGAGTVDSSLFHVKPAKGGRWDFEFFTSVVEPNGVSNLHRHRVDWWSDELINNGAPESLWNELVASRLVTDLQLAIPESFEDYFSGIKTTFQNGALTPDRDFYVKRVLSQVRGRTYWRTWKEKLLTQEQLRGISLFICGGGIRMQYYGQLERDLEHMEGYTWLCAYREPLSVPDDLVADGLPVADYDRLSVAYGLSRLQVGKIVRALPAPRLHDVQVSQWRDSYIDKDQC